jgi:hypothetical protein
MARGRHVEEAKTEELERYINSAEFKQRYATVLAQQKAGEHLMREQLAKLLGVSLWIAEIAIRYAARKEEKSILGLQIQKSLSGSAHDQLAGAPAMN